MTYVNSISVTPKSITLEVGSWFYEARAEVSPSTATCPEVIWSTGDPSVASVNAANGYIRAVGEGTTEIYADATDGSDCGDYLTVKVVVPVSSVTLNRSNLSLEKGQSEPLFATVCPDNASNKDLNWTSSDNNIATVSNGIVTAVGNGSARITATAADGSGKSASCLVTVTGDVLVSFITVVPSSKTMTVGDSTFLSVIVNPSNATKKSVSWSSSNKNVVTVNETTGLIMAQSAGAATVYATACDGSGVAGYCFISVNAQIPVERIEVSPETLKMCVGETKALSAEVFPTNATNKKIRWTSENSDIAEVNYFTGCVTAKAEGSINIYANAQDGSDVNAQCKISVTPYCNIINKASNKVVNIQGANIDSLTANQNVTLYKSTGSNEQIWRIDNIPTTEEYFVKSYVDETFGLNVNKRKTNYLNCDVTKLSGNENDSAVYLISQGNGYYKIRLVNIIEDYCYYMTAKGTTDGSDIRWETAQESDSQLWRLEIVEGTAPIPVEHIEVSPETLQMNVGETKALSAEVSPENATNKAILWTSEDCNIADVDSTGHVTAKAVGSTYIYAEALDGSGVIGSCLVTVNEMVDTLLTIKDCYVRLDTSDSDDTILRKANGKNRVVLRASSKDTVQLLESINVDGRDWYQILYEGMIAYVTADSFEEITTEKPPLVGVKNVRVNTGDGSKLDVRNKPYDDDNKSDSLGKFADQTIIQLMSDTPQKDNWYPVYGQLDNGNYSYGWCYGDYLSEALMEYHIIPYSDKDNESQALQIKVENTKNEYDEVSKIVRLNSDERLQLDRFSYVNRQKWFITETGTTCKIYTVHGDGYCLCKKNGNTVYVSNNASYKSNLSIDRLNSSPDLARIKLWESGRWLCLTVSGDNIVWAELDSNNSNQIWKLREKTADIHNGADTPNPLYDDSVTDKDRTIRACKLGGEEFVIRYYADENKILQKNKILSVKEAEALHRHGINIVLVYQDAGNNDIYFSADLGKENAEKALELAESLHQKPNSAIYFAVDYDAQSSSELQHIKNYFEAIESVFNRNGNKYRIGVYGSGKVCNHVKNCVQLSWLCGATGFGDYDTYDSTSNYNIKQAEYIYYNGTKFDDCIAVGNDYGQWKWDE